MQVWECGDLYCSTEVVQKMRYTALPVAGRG